MIIIDTETTGLSPRRNSIISIGAVDFLHPKNTFYGECQMWPDAEVSQYALNVNGFSQQELTDPQKPTHNELLETFFTWVAGIETKTFAGQNPSFDFGFLSHAAKQASLDWPFGYRAIDLQSVCYAHYLKYKSAPPMKNGKVSFSLDGIAQYVGLPPEPHPHNALQGAEYAAECFGRLIYDVPLLEKFHEHPVTTFQ